MADISLLYGKERKTVAPGKSPRRRLLAKNKKRFSPNLCYPCTGFFFLNVFFKVIRISPIVAGPLSRRRQEHTQTHKTHLEPGYAYSYRLYIILYYRKRYRFFSLRRSLAMTKTRPPPSRTTEIIIKNIKKSPSATTTTEAASDQPTQMRL